VRELVQRYVAEVTPGKKSARSERLRLQMWADSPFGTAWADAVRPSMLAQWRDDRVASGRAGSTVRNDLNALSAVYRHAASEWGYERLENPAARLKRPAIGAGRTRRVGDAELEALKRCTQSSELPTVIDLAVETGMRLSEIVTLRWERVDLRTRTLELVDTKNGYGRVVPLSTRAVGVLSALRGDIVRRLDGRVFAISPHSATVAFRRAAARLRQMSGSSMGVDLHFHDLRHEAVSRLFERGLSVVEVAAISGHRSIQMLHRYCHMNARALTAKLG
jgi:integrase